jgi:hypothetical protein
MDHLVSRAENLVDIAGHLGSAIENLAGAMAQLDGEAVNPGHAGDNPE